jgi:RNA polymerase sigma-70 factor (ECF subfamily)
VPDRQLIERVAANDESAFQILYDRYFPRVYAFTNRRMRNRADVEETVQEVFFNVFSSLGSFRSEAPFAAWVLGVARRTIASRYKKKQHVMVSLDDAHDDDGGDSVSRLGADQPTPLEHYECSERIARMEATASEVLTEEQWRLFTLHHLEHRSVRDIAHALEKSEDAVKSNLYRARKLLLAR